ncbi:C40 family peptidase [Virgibacillus sp. NKC19-16]|uniref:NlpC/P60 family protein n=1 Tax=Virgibacillus salidurans TaxID=2831673 RepID=UPI001F2B510A|nr:NlpC/P60 family protein [Virgibacillus sp. NKC19-16]UJL47173.1 C40 family peptidase [Virgibacillus sp. NKC19-16]
MRIQRFALLLFLYMLILFALSPGFAKAEEWSDPAAELALDMVGSNNQGFLTSEFVQYVYEESKSISLPKYAADQKQIGEEIKRSELQPGDVVFFQGSSLMSGVYINDGRFMIVTSDGITERNMETSEYWSGAYAGAAQFTEEDVDDPAAVLALDKLGENQEGWITSELVQYVYEDAKSISLPQSAADQWIQGEDVDELQPGDVVFFQGTHLMSGIYINNGRFVIVTSEGISERNMETSDYWSNTYQGAKRYTEEDTSPPSENEIIELARDLIETPYNRTGESPEEGFNSGSFVYYVYKDVTGSWLSKRPSSQLEAGRSIDRDELQPGDLVFFENEEQEIISGIYSGDDQFVIAASSGVQERHLDYHNYYAERYIGAARYTDEILEKSNPETYENHESPVVREAMNYLGTPYLMTGDTLDAFDCSFLVQTVFREALDVYLPRISYRQWEVGETLLPEGTDIESIDLDEELQPGDALYFSGTWQEGISHTGIYLGEDYIIHATGGEGQTTISYMSEYWRDHFTGAKRFQDLAIQYDNDVVYEAYQLLGTEYTPGGSAPDEGFDTGGFVQYVYNQAWQYDLPRYGRKQWEEGTEISRDEVEPGDIFFFQGTSIIPTIYIGNNQMIAVTASSGVTVIDLTTSDYWPPRYMGARTYDTEVRESEEVQLAEQYVGESFDETSAEFIKRIYAEASGTDLPSNVEELREYGDQLHVEELQQGDLMFFSDLKGGTASVMAGIYAGDGAFITVIDGEIVSQTINDEPWINRLIEGRTISTVETADDR